MFATSTHSDYAPTGFSVTEGKVLGERLTAAFTATRPDDGTFGPTILNPSILATGIVATDSGKGYWLSMNQGGLNGLGDAGIGDQPQAPLNAPVVGITGRPASNSYWMAGADGSVYAGLPDDPLPGSMASRPLTDPVVGSHRPPAATATGSPPPIAESSPSATPSSMAPSLMSNSTRAYPATDSSGGAEADPQFSACSKAAT